MTEVRNSSPDWGRARADRRACRPAAVGRLMRRRPYKSTRVSQYLFVYLHFHSGPYDFWAPGRKVAARRALVGGAKSAPGQSGGFCVAPEAGASRCATGPVRLIDSQPIGGTCAEVGRLWPRAGAFNVARPASFVSLRPGQVEWKDSGSQRRGCAGGSRARVRSHGHGHGPFHPRPSELRLRARRPAAAQGCNCALVGSSELCANRIH